MYFATPNGGCGWSHHLFVKLLSLAYDFHRYFFYHRYRPRFMCSIAKNTHIGSFGVVLDDPCATPRGRRRAPEVETPSDTIERHFRIQKKHVNPPAPHEGISRRRSSSAPLTHEASPHFSAKRHAGVSVGTSERVFPTAQSQPSTPRIQAPPSILSWEGGDASTPAKRPVRKSSSNESNGKEFSLKSLTGERRHVDTPGQVAGGLFSSIFGCGKMEVSDHVRPILRQKNNCVAHGEAPKPKPFRLMRKCSTQSHDRGFMFVDSAVVPLSRPHP